MSDLINRQDAIEACESIRRSAIIEDGEPLVRKSAVKYVLEKLPSAQPEIIRCNDCKYWNEGNCNCPDIRVDCPDYYVGDIVTEEDFYCGFAKRREE